MAIIFLIGICQDCDKNANHFFTTQYIFIKHSVLVLGERKERRHDDGDGDGKNQGWKSERGNGKLVQRVGDGTVCAGEARGRFVVWLVRWLADSLIVCVASWFSC